ncbi:MAG: hypothetical protein V7K32_09230 [Nostoc sp.]|uniref:hypothetical protein n=1 Tax=Nostoc sp. TaxID=1180 RepID=UPI002FF796C7
MSKPNPNFHTVNKNGTIILHSNHLGDVVEVHIDKVKRRFYGIREDGTVIEDSADYGNDFKQPVMIYKIYYSFEKDAWGMNYITKDNNEHKWIDGFNTAREAWLYREVLIAEGIAIR